MNDAPALRQAEVGIAVSGATALAAAACVGVFVGMHGLAELRPLPLAQTALIVGYAMVCSLVVNDLVKTILVARAARVGTGQDKRPAANRGPESPACT